MGLRRFLDAPTAETRPAAPGCELCGASIRSSGHAHAVDLDARRLLCVCTACRLLLTDRGGARGRYRTVPDRYRRVPDFTVTRAQWEELGIPVRFCFTFRNSRLGQYVAQYPSPAGATEALLPTAVWQRVLAANPPASEAADDVEALLLRRQDHHVECHLVPIDACYRLVARVRTHWQGFDGRGRVRAETDAFFEHLQAREQGGIR
ncbi:hypothetical protein H9Y04_15265 [Streptomyces sp. TRM66268-LWL]|uniref:HNH endonuclease n=1 Tax=Streptomyces polyasparticus TaxID=2767826 RepID=A0ABR7SG10_9ACTN|nr:DUF5947 family protein [Streptomyces polyasparticus]MBC9713927.1 hypothetical protein [Streptomyces polyasparticus]